MSTDPETMLREVAEKMRPAFLKEYMEGWDSGWNWGFLSALVGIGISILLIKWLI